ncbi:MAG: hypothetical protein CM15mP85_27460 [Rhodobacterales bacterium]|nr:MAG: hypothetical protein CM15mP85_27460 [Rhodobacterales bacterium]
MPKDSGIGAAIKRREDARFLLEAVVTVMISHY